MFVIDSGATSTTTHDKDDFKPGTLRLFQPGEQAPIQGIAGNLSIEGEGTIAIQVVSDEGKLVDIETHAYYIPALGTRLFSPQGCMVDRKDSSQFVMERNQAMLLLDDPLTSHHSI